MGRTHVHFATGVPKAHPPPPASSPLSSLSSLSSALPSSPELNNNQCKSTNGKAAESTIISGMRTNASLLIWVSVRKSLVQGGLKWWRSANGVVLTEGDEKGFVATEWIERVVRRRDGQVIWKQKGDGKESLKDKAE